MKKRTLIVISIIILEILIIATMYIISKRNNKEPDTLGNDNEQPQVNNSDENKDINSIDDFYNIDLTKDKDIRDLGKLYNSFDAQKDNCFVIGAMVHNDNLYYDFMQDCKNDKSSYIRVAKNTTEGDLTLYDILYYEETNKLYLVSDYTRDEFSAVEDRTIEMKQFEKITEYTYKNRLYWVLYNGELNDETFKTENVFVITIIN